MEQARLAVSRCAADLFWKQGVDGTSGDDIAEAAGISKRTIWRYFRSKEACIEPLLLATRLRFVGYLNEWPRDASIETCLHAMMKAYSEDDQATRDAVSATRIVALLPKEPGLQEAWLMACSLGEAAFIPIVAERAGRPPEDFDVRLCAAAMMAAVRVLDEAVCAAAYNEGQTFEQDALTDRLAAVMRTASTLPICDPLETASGA